MRELFSIQEAAIRSQFNAYGYQVTKARFGVYTLWDNMNLGVAQAVAREVSYTRLVHEYLYLNGDITNERYQLLVK